MGDVKKKVPDVSGLVTTTVLNTKISEIENEILNLSVLVKKIDQDAKISDINRNNINRKVFHFLYNK